MKKGIVYAVAALMSVTMAYTAAGCSKSSGNQPEKVYTAEPADKTEGEDIVFSSAWTGKEEPVAETATEPFDTDTPEETTEKYLPENTSPHGGTAGETSGAVMSAPAYASSKTDTGTAAGKTHSQADSWQTLASTRPAVQKQTDEDSVQPATQKQYTPAVTQPTTGKQTTTAVTQPATQKQTTAAATQPVTQKQTTTAAMQPVTQKQTTAAATKPAEKQTTAPAKSIYEYPYDIEAIRADLIAYGESLGYIHDTTKPDGTPITPDNSSWAPPQYGGAGMQSTILEKNLKERIESYPKKMCEGDPSIGFTIYIETDGIEYNFYVLVG